MEERDDELEIITVTDDETGEEIEFAVVDYTVFGGNEFLLVVELACLEDDESEACILKKIIENGEEYYTLVEDDLEFQAVAELFEAEGEEYDIQL